jgi:hypothetical protein
MNGTVRTGAAISATPPYIGSMRAGKRRNETIRELRSRREAFTLKAAPRTPTVAPKKALMAIASLPTIGPELLANTLALKKIAQATPAHFA